jgi:hypothetical protein
MFYKSSALRAVVKIKTKIIHLKILTNNLKRYGMVAVVVVK